MPYTISDGAGNVRGVTASGTMIDMGNPAQQARSTVISESLGNVYRYQDYGRPQPRSTPTISVNNGIPSTSGITAPSTSQITPSVPNVPSRPISPVAGSAVSAIAGAGAGAIAGPAGRAIGSTLGDGLRNLLNKPPLTQEQRNYINKELDQGRIPDFEKFKPGRDIPGSNIPQGFSPTNRAPSGNPNSDEVPGTVYKVIFYSTNNYSNATYYVYGWEVRRAVMYGPNYFTFMPKPRAVKRQNPETGILEWTPDWTDYNPDPAFGIGIDPATLVSEIEYRPPVDPQAPTPGFNPATVPPSWVPAQFLTPPQTLPKVSPNPAIVNNPELNKQKIPNVTPAAQQNLQQRLEQQGGQQQQRQQANPGPINFGRLVPPSTQNRVGPIPVQNLQPNQGLNTNLSPTNQFREQLERQFNPQPNVDQQSAPSCNNQCIADIQNQLKANGPNNGVATVQVNRFLMWNRLTGRPIYVPETVTVPRGMESFALMMGNRTADMRSRFALNEIRMRAMQILNTLGTISTLHNAAMLSADLGQTLGSIIDQGVQRLAPMFGVDNDTAEQFDFNTVLGGAIDAQMKTILGEEVWNGTKKTWHRLNRVITTASNVLWNLQSITDSTRSLIELGIEGNNRLANALRRNRIVDENAYPTMPEQVNGATGRMGRIQRMMNGLEQVSEAASTIENVVSTVGSIQDELKSSIESADELKKAWNDATKPVDDKDKQSTQDSKSPDIQPGDRQKGDPA